ncbi:hypothetical protein NDU88_006919 [Pleurodeles waltl]|uniref:Uncharacterized protein n=1 Tax=Pleurodeles waltl TaxID=8319 RepID=A0AAV7N295_PLEWA|nr:hypothetical protein NDU88_006919 [Pleurodeles waltl]
MVKHKGSKVPQTNKIVNYAQPVQPPVKTEKERDQGLKAPEQGMEDPISSLKDLILAIQGSKTEVIPKTDVIAVEVNLLRADLHKVSDQVGTAKQDIAVLQAEVGRLRKICFRSEKTNNTTG